MPRLLLMVVRWIGLAAAAAAACAADGAPPSSLHSSGPAGGLMISPNWMELGDQWRMMSADRVSQSDQAVSLAHFDASGWYPVRHMPATVLEVLVENGVYPNLYYGMNLATPGDLWKKDWWYRTTFTVPAGQENYSLVLRGINYRADLWVNGEKIADKSQVVGMYNSFEFDISRLVHSGGENGLALKITPEQAIPGKGPVELGDTWHDWLNWKYIGFHDPEKNQNFSFPPDRNAG
ncbi:MAG: beta galactosidase jelly roll domain-containing protein, partial [Acidobacteria bacterium]|nr:beta galactosidase jelly roll domain-containing protein [Acidobacteriota bacterium]